MQAAGSLLLAFGEGMAPLAAGCVLFGLGVGNLVSLPPLIAQSEFRPADVGTVVALVTAINQAVFAFAPVSFGWLHDLDDSYIVASWRQRSPKPSRQRSSSMVGGFPEAIQRLVGRSHDFGGR